MWLPKTAADAFTCVVAESDRNELGSDPSNADQLDIPLGPAPAAGLVYPELSGPLYMLTRSCYLAVMGEREEPWEFMLNVISRGFDLRVIPEILGWRQMGTVSRSRVYNRLPCVLDRIQAYEKLLPLELRDLASLAYNRLRNAPHAATILDQPTSMKAQATIVIPLLRQVDAWLDQAVRSAIRQTAPCEVVVVTSQETPQSNRDVLGELASRHDNLRVLFRDLPRGFPQTVNFGMRAATTDRIGILLSDDWLDPDCIAECLAHNADIVSTSRAIYHEDGVTPVANSTRILRLKEYLRLETLESQAAYLTHFFLFRKAALECAGYLDESIGDFPGIDDHHLIWTMLEQGASVALIERRLYNVRDHDGERLTLADADEARRNLGKILHKHHVLEPEFSRLLEAHGHWYGKTLYAVLGARHTPVPEK